MYVLLVVERLMGSLLVVIVVRIKLRAQIVNGGGYYCYCCY